MYRQCRQIEKIITIILERNEPLKIDVILLLVYMISFSIFRIITLLTGESAMSYHIQLDKINIKHSMRLLFAFLIQ